MYAFIFISKIPLQVHFLRKMSHHHPIAARPYDVLSENEMTKYHGFWPANNGSIGKRHNIQDGKELMGTMPLEGLKINTSN